MKRKITIVGGLGLAMQAAIQKTLQTEEQSVIFTKTFEEPKYVNFDNVIDTSMSIVRGPASKFNPIPRKQRREEARQRKKMKVIV